MTGCMFHSIVHLRASIDLMYIYMNKFACYSH